MLRKLRLSQKYGFLMKKKTCTLRSYLEQLMTAKEILIVKGGLSGQMT